MVSHTILRCASVFREKSHKQNSPVRVASGDTEAEGGGEVKPETLPELSSDRCDGHLVVDVCKEVVGGELRVVVVEEDVGCKARTLSHQPNNYK